MNTSTIPASPHPTNLGLYFLILGCLATLSALCGGVIFAVFGSLLGSLWLWLMVVLLAQFNPEVHRQHGFRAIADAVVHGFVLLVPFVVLALVAGFLLHWQVAQAFTGAGLMAAGAATGGEMTKLGGGRIAGSLLPLLGTLLLSLAWMLLSIHLLGG